MTLCRSPRTALLVALLLGLAARAEASSSGLDTPKGVTTLPLAVQGAQGMSLIGGTNADGTAITPYVSITSKLQAAGNGTGSAWTGATGCAGNYTGLDVNGTIDTSCGNGYNVMSSPTDLDLYINRPLYQNIHFRENNVDQFLIAAGGNIGIGTVSPSAKLQIQTTDNNYGTGLSLINSSTGADAQAKLQLTQGANSSYIYQQSDNLFVWGASGGNIDFSVNNGASTPLALQGANGYVGIGSTVPVYPLDVKRIGSSGAVVRASDTVSNNAIVLSTNPGDGSVGVGITGAGGQYWNAGVSSTGTYYIGQSSTAWGLQLSLLGILTVKTSLLQLSDQRLKKDIVPIDHALDKITHITGVTFHWRDKKSDPREQMGVIAQDIEKIFPDAVNTGDDGYKSVNYSSLVAPLIQSVKELKADNDELRGQIAEIRREVPASR